MSRLYLFRRSAARCAGPFTANEPHTSCIIRLTRVIVRELGDAALVGPQSAIRLSNYSEPQPDIVLLRYRHDSHTI